MTTAPDKGGRVDVARKERKKEKEDWMNEFIIAAG